MHPEQIPEAVAVLREVGVPADFAPDGAAILGSRSERKRHMKARGYRDLDAGYGDG